MRKLLNRLFVLGVVALVVVVAGKDIAGEMLDDLLGPARGTVMKVEGDYVREVGPAVIEYEAKPGEITYCPLDTLGRARCAYGQLTQQMRWAEYHQEREELTVNPAGWGSNQEVTIKALPDVRGSRDYRGWFWNRSHLLADSLGGAAVAENLVTGTRTQNVGSTMRDGKHAGGMAWAESQARAWLDSTKAANCSLYYAATPVYTGDELIPRAVFVDMLSCDGSINMRVEVLNTANGYEIDYTRGTFRALS